MRKTASLDSNDHLDNFRNDFPGYQAHNILKGEVGLDSLIRLIILLESIDITGRKISLRKTNGARPNYIVYSAEQSFHTSQLALRLYQPLNLSKLIIKVQALRI